MSPNLISTHGDDYIYFRNRLLCAAHPWRESFGGDGHIGQKNYRPGREVEKTIAEYVCFLIKDGDTIEVGVGGAAKWILQSGTLENRQDLGIHSENFPKGMAALVMAGAVTGRLTQLRKNNFHSLWGGTKEEMDFINIDHPDFKNELRKEARILFWS